MRTHRPLFSITLSFISGILMEPFVPMGFAALFTVAFFSGAMAAITFRKKRISAVFICVAFVFLGLLFSRNIQHLPKDHVYRIARYYRGQDVWVEGHVVSDVEKKDFFKAKKTSFLFEIQRFKTKWGWRRKQGKVLVHVFRDEAIFYGDTLRLNGKIYEPFDFLSEGKFSYKDYLRAKGVRLIFSVKKKGVVRKLGSQERFSLKSVSIKARGRLKGIFLKHLTKNEAGIMQAIILGDRTQIPKHIQQIFVQTGTAHILAISGLHVGIVAFLVFLTVRLLPIGRKAWYLLTILFLLFYATLTGARPSVIRSTIMAVVFIGGFLFERDVEPINSLSLAALIILLVNPLHLYDIGFQLSFISVLSILCFFNLFLSCFLKHGEKPQHKAVEFMLQSFCVSLSAWIGVAGLIAYYFHILTPVAVLANLVVIPMISVLVALGLALLLIGGLFPQAGFICASCIKFMLNLMAGCSYLFGQLPYSFIYFNRVIAWYCMGYYIIIFLVYVYIIMRKKRIDPPSSN